MTGQSEPSRPISGCGLGFRRSLIADLLEHCPDEISFLELAPENWINVGGTLGERLRYFGERYPFVCHGLSLSLGGPDPLDTELLANVKNFLRRHRVAIYSEHLSYCADGGHLYDLMPIPFTDEAVHYVAARIKQTQEIVEQKIAIENVSAYIAPAQEMTETDFINAVLEEADCLLLLDVNNVYVNSVNFGFDARAYLDALPAHRIAYCHVAGHRQEAPGLIVDTHGAAVVMPVWDLLDQAYARFGALPTLLERDFNFPEFEQLLEELRFIKQCQERCRRHAPPSTLTPTAADVSAAL